MSTAACSARIPAWPHFTVGQRRGLAVADGERLYVVGIEPGTRRVVVGPGRRALCAGSSSPGSTGWPMPADPARLPVEVKHRYNEPAVPARLEALPDGRAVVDPASPQPGIAPGQACVCYAGTPPARRRLDRTRAAAGPEPGHPAQRLTVQAPAPR